MASNTLGGINPTRISQLSLDVLKTVGVPLRAFTTDLTDDVAVSGDVVTTRFATVPSTQDFDSSKATGNSTTTARSVTLNKYKGVSIGFKDTEVAFSDVDLLDLYIKPAISSIVDGMISDVLANVTSGNGFNANESVITASALDSDKVADLAQGLSTRKVPMSPRSLILKPSYYVTLLKDATFVAASDGPSGTGPIRDYNLPRSLVFDVYEYNGTVPANDINMAGLACGKQALVIANRAIPTPSDWYGNVQNITDPDSGLTLQMRSFYDGVEQVYQFAALYGSAVGIDEYATAIVSS